MAVEIITLFGTQAYGEAIGRCIYCGSDGGEEGLSNEHIIAFCLASDSYLAKASCESCAKKTSYLEGYAGRHIFGPMRRHFGIQSRRKKTELGSATLIAETQHGEVTRRIPREGLPVTVFLPIWEPPGLFRDGVCTPVDQCGIWRWQEDNAEEKLKALKLEGELSFRIVSQVRPLVIARMLAKIAHAMATAVLGVDAFVPYLPRIILGEDENAALLIGGAAPPTAPLPAIPYSERTHHHTVGLAIMSSPGKPSVVVTTVRLFEHIGTPTYWVIVGEALRPAFERLREEDGAQAP